jgi:selenocysteine lyase/cysteine desulfurase
MDYSAFLVIPACIMFHQWLGESISRNTQLAKWGSKVLCTAWGTKLLASIDMQASMITIAVPSTQECNDTCNRSQLHDQLLQNYGIQVPVMNINGTRYIRISVASYTNQEDIIYLAESVLKTLYFPIEYDGFRYLQQVRQEFS